MRAHLVLLGMIFVLVLIAAATGVFYQTDGLPFQYTTVRGEQAIFHGSGLYRFDPAWFARLGIIWDAINLFLGLPLFASAIALTARNSLRGRLLLGGLLFYLTYAYLTALMAYSLNALFLVYLLIFALSAVAFLMNLSRIDIAGLPAHLPKRFPRRLFIAFSWLVAATLTILWVGRIIPIMMTGHFPPDLAGLDTLRVEAADLGIIVPLMVATGILLQRRSPWGYLLTSVSLGYGSLMSVAIPAFIVVPLIQDGKTSLLEAIPFSLICLAGICVALIFYRSVREDDPVAESGAVPTETRESA